MTKTVYRCNKCKTNKPRKKFFFLGIREKNKTSSGMKYIRFGECHVCNQTNKEKTIKKE